MRLLERLLAVVIPGDKARGDITVLDPFGGSLSTPRGGRNGDIALPDEELQLRATENNENQHSAKILIF